MSGGNWREFTGNSGRSGRVGIGRSIRRKSSVEVAADFHRATGAVPLRRVEVATGVTAALCVVVLVGERAAVIGGS
jgi:hypothetical protein